MQGNANKADEIEVATVANQLPTSCNQLQAEEKQEFKDRINFLESELSKEREHSREQSTRLADLAEQMAELTRNNQVLLKQEQDRNNLQISSSVTSTTTDQHEPNRGTEEIKNKKSFWSFLKR